MCCIIIIVQNWLWFVCSFWTASSVCGNRVDVWSSRRRGCSILLFIEIQTVSNLCPIVFRDLVYGATNMGVRRRDKHLSPPSASWWGTRWGKEGQPSPLPHSQLMGGEMAEGGTSIVPPLQPVDGGPDGRRRDRHLPSLQPPSGSGREGGVR